MFSIIFPMDLDRLEQFMVTKRLYDAMPQDKEFLIPTRSYDKLWEYLVDNDLANNVRLIPYTVEQGFNCSKALNLGVKNAQYGNIIITSPEVKPVTSVLEQLAECRGQNIVCWVDDEAEDGKLSPLVHKAFRGETPGMYFLAMFNRDDIVKINGWDEDFMRGYAYEDNDFGDRWVRAGLPFEIREDIKAVHQYHPRLETIKGGSSINANHYYENTENGVIQCKNGLRVIL